MGNVLLSYPVQEFTLAAQLNNPKCRWQITAGFAILLGIIGFVLGCSIDTKNPDDRMVDILIPTMALSTIGALIGYVSALIYYRRFRWFDSLVSLAIPFLGIFGFWIGKSGNLTAFRVCNVAVFIMIGYLVIRYWITKDKYVLLDAKTLDNKPMDEAGRIT